MTQPIDLRRLPVEAAAPFGFDEFERRIAAADRRRRANTWSAAASVGTLGVVALLALMTQVPEPAAVFPGPQPMATVAADAPYEPAVVDVGRFEVTSELQDHIALLDAQISAARIYAAPPERLRQMESTRAQLNESLQRVSYAQALLSF